jgi:hypothetical protein
MHAAPKTELYKTTAPTVIMALRIISRPEAVGILIISHRCRLPRWRQMISQARHRRYVHHEPRPSVLCQAMEHINVRSSAVKFQSLRRLFVMEFAMNDHARAVASLKAGQRRYDLGVRQEFESLSSDGLGTVTLTLTSQGPDTTLTS